MKFCQIELDRKSSIRKWFSSRGISFARAGRHGLAAALPARFSTWRGGARSSISTACQLYRAPAGRRTSVVAARSSQQCRIATAYAECSRTARQALRQYVHDQQRPMSCAAYCSSMHVSCQLCIVPSSATRAQQLHTDHTDVSDAGPSGFIAHMSSRSASRSYI